MARVLTIVLLCFGLNSASAAEPKPSNEAKVPARIEAACARAKGELAYVCSEYKLLFEERERSRKQARELERQAVERLKELTRGGIANTLQ